MFCRNCGKQIPDRAVFCPECGAKQNITGNGVQLEKPGASGDKKHISNKTIGIIVVALIAAAVIALSFLCFGGRSYKKVVNDMITASIDGDAKTIFYLMPKNVRKAILEEGDFKNDQEAIASMSDYLSSYSGLITGMNVDHKITKVRNLDKAEIDEIIDDYEIMEIENFHIRAAKEVEVELSVSSGSGESKVGTMDLVIIKLGRSWYIDAMNSF